MMLRAARPDGAVCYGSPANWGQGSATDRLIFRIGPAIAEDPQTTWYTDHIADGLTTSAARFLFHFSADDLASLQARITACYMGRVSRKTLIGARYTYFDETGTLWLRGAYVTNGARGRRIGPAMAATAFFDWHLQGRSASNLAANVLVKNGVPNRKSVAALRKLGFDLTDQGVVVRLKGDVRDRHLLPFAETIDGHPCVRRRRMVLPAARIPAAIGFLKTWRG